MKQLLVFLTSIAAVCILLATAAASPSTANAGSALSAHEETLPGQLLSRGDRVYIAYKLEERIKAPTGRLYVRNDLQRRLQRLAMTLNGKPMRGGATLSTIVPGRLLRGRRLL